jgi:hypothetical protein
MKESGRTPKDKGQIAFKIVRDIPSGKPALERAAEASTHQDKPLTSETYTTILGEFQRLGFLGENLLSKVDLITWHTFVKEYDLGVMNPDRVVGRMANLKITNEDDGVRTEIDTVVYNSHYRKADPLEDDQRPKARMLLLVVPEPGGYSSEEKVRVDTIITDAGQVQFAVEPRVTEIADDEKRAADLQKEVDRWGFPVELRHGINDQKGVLSESGGKKFAEQLKKFDENARNQTFPQE